MPLPTATYRLQFNGGFRFQDAVELVDYLQRLGISHVYASPVLKSRAGSTHGYDVTDPTTIDPEIGSEEEFAALANSLQERGMSLLLDIVPNHMAADVQNPWWNDVLANGQRSRYAAYFDVDWERGGGKMVLPILTVPVEQALAGSELEVVEEGGSPRLQCGEITLPIAPGTYKESDSVPEILERQHYLLDYWRTGNQRLNYRRFFAVSDLVSLREEDPEVFHDAHREVLRLVRAGHVSGLRVDHVDGLHDPKAYLDRLQMAAQAHAVDPTGEFYVVIEKILAKAEQLPPDWRCHGTTGYEFMTMLNGLFIDAEGLRTLESVYADFTGQRETYDDLVYAAKRQVMAELFSGELRAAGDRLCRLAQEDDAAAHLGESALRTALEEVTASLSVYRTYIRSPEVGGADRARVNSAVSAARSRSPGTPGEALDFVLRVLTLEDPADTEEWLAFVMRWQQLTGPITAKGVEDTAFYRYNRLISMNEVGGEPSLGVTSVEDFHAANLRVLRSYPLTLNSTSTHDTKRSEDVRARLNVLSEIPNDWRAAVERWRAHTAPYRTQIEGGTAPDPRQEYAIYQTVVGAWPADGDASSMRARLHTVIEKSLREAKVHTTWDHPDAEYEAAVHRFIEGLFDDGEFMAQVAAFAERTAFPWVVNSLAQVVLKSTVPGLPDVYQGTELWDFSLVDPDNRRPVDFDRRVHMLNEMPSDATHLLSNWRDGGIKLHTLQRVLSFRRSHPALFAEGDYVPLAAAGQRSSHVVAFARRAEGQWVLVVVPRLVARFGGWPIGGAWGDTVIELPEGSPARWRNVTTGGDLRTAGEVHLADVLADLPVAVLEQGI